MFIENKITLTTLKPVHIIGTFLGIWPSFNTSTMAKCGRHYIYGIIAIVLLLCQLAYTIYGKVIHQKQIDHSVFVMLILSDLATTTTNIAAIININFLQGERLFKFLQQLQHLESVFWNVKMDNPHKKRNFYMHLIFAHCVFFVYMGYNFWVWTHSLGWGISKYSVLRDVQFYHVFVTVRLVRSYVLLIKSKVEDINYVLEHHSTLNIGKTKNASSRTSLNNDFNQSTENGIFIVAKTIDKRNFCGSPKKNNHQIIASSQEWDLDYISKIYTKLSNVVSEFNEIFGWTLVFLEIQLIVNLLLALNLALVYGGGEVLMGTVMDFNLYVLCFIWFAIPLANMITVISACDKTTREINKMPSICYNLILNVNTKNYDMDNDREYIKKVKELAQQGHMQRPEFTAAGFFRFNYSLVFPTMTSIISYFIVLVQFRS